MANELGWREGQRERRVVHMRIYARELACTGIYYSSSSVCCVTTCIQKVRERVRELVYPNVVVVAVKEENDGVAGGDDDDVTRARARVAI